MNKIKKNKIEKYMNFIIQKPKKGNKPRFLFIGGLHFSNNSLHYLIKNLRKNNFYDLSQEFNALDLLKKILFFLSECWKRFEKSK